MTDNTENWLSLVQLVRRRGVLPESFEVQSGGLRLDGGPGTLRLILSERQGVVELLVGLTKQRIVVESDQRGWKFVTTVVNGAIAGKIGLRYRKRTRFSNAPRAMYTLLTSDQSIDPNDFGSNFDQNPLGVKSIFILAPYGRSRELQPRGPADEFLFGDELLKIEREASNVFEIVSRTDIRDNPAEFAIFSAMFREDLLYLSVDSVCVDPIGCFVEFYGGPGTCSMRLCVLYDELILEVGPESTTHRFDRTVEAWLNLRDLVQRVLRGKVTLREEIKPISLSAGHQYFCFLDNRPEFNASSESGQRGGKTIELLDFAPYQFKTGN